MFEPLRVQRDGSPPKIGAELESEVDLPAILGGVDALQRLKPFQRQRATRLAHRMRNFGYTPHTLSLLCLHYPDDALMPPL